MPGVKKAKKPKLVQKVATRPKSKRNKSTKAKEAKGSKSVPRMDPFVECVFGPVGATTQGGGVPDGDPKPGYVLDHRSVLVVLPDSGGNISVALTPSVNGCLALGAGKAQVITNLFDLATGTSQGTTSQLYNAESSPLTGGEDRFVYRVVPFEEWLAPAGVTLHDQGTGQAGVFGNGMTAEAFRVVTNTGEATYTGPPLTASGMVATSRFDVHVDEVITESARYPGIQAGQDVFRGAIVSNICETPPLSFFENSIQPAAVIAQATQCQKALNVPVDWKYEPIRLTQPNASPTTGFVNTRNLSPTFGVLMNENGTPNWAAMPMGGLGHAPTTVFTYTGLAPDAVVVFNGRSCIQYTINRRSQVRHMARPSPPLRPAALAAVAAIAPSIPVSAPSVSTSVGNRGWLESALGWYAGAMKKAIGGSWEVGSQLVSELLPGKYGQKLGGLTEGMAHLMIGNG